MGFVSFGPLKGFQVSVMESGVGAGGRARGGEGGHDGGGTGWAGI